MFKTVFAADIGSKCIKCVARGQVAAEETAIALEAGAKLTVAAAGSPRRVVRFFFAAKHKTAA